MTEEAMVESPGEGDPGEGPGEFGRFVRAVVRLLLAALLGLLLGVGIYWGTPALFRAFMEPVEANSARIAGLESELKAMRTAQRQSEDRLGERLAALEGQDVSQGELLSELASELTEIEGRLQEQAVEFGELEEHAQRLETLESEMAILEAEIEDIQREDRVSAEDELGRQLQRLRLMELIARARLEILSQNYGLARENIDAAGSAADELLTGASGIAVEDLEAVAERLESASAELAERPAVAADDLEVAWRLLTEATAPQ